MYDLIPGRPKKTWDEVMQKDLRDMGLNRETYHKSCFLYAELVSGHFQATLGGHTVLEGSLQVGAVHLLGACPDVVAGHDDGGRLGLKRVNDIRHHA